MYMVGLCLLTNSNDTKTQRNSVPEQALKEYATSEWCLVVHLVMIGVCNSHDEGDPDSHSAYRELVIVDPPAGVWLTC